MRYLGLKETKTSKKSHKFIRKTLISYTTQNKKNSFKKVCSIGDRELKIHFFFLATGKIIFLQLGI